VWRLRKAASLVKLLALSPGHRMHREQVMEVLWPGLGPRAAANNLRHVLHVARRVFDPDPSFATRLLSLQGDQLVLCPSEQLRVDVEAFEETAAAARRSKDTLAYRTAIELYAGELLPEDRYEEWAQGRREELRRLHLALLDELAGLYEERGEHGPAVEALRRVEAEEPTLEEVHTRLMRLYALSGRRGEAIAQYGRLHGILSSQLGAEPSAATRRLRDEIAAGGLPPTHLVATQPEEPPDTSKHNLPAPSSSFVGREREIVEVKRLLAMSRRDIYAMSSDGSNQTPITSGPENDNLPSWQPTEANPPPFPGENGRIAFHSNWNPPDNTNPEGDLEIFTMKPDGSAIEQLTKNGTTDSTPAFSPDGNSIIFATDRDGNVEIYKMSTDGSSQTRLTNNPASDFYPVFSPDGNSIIFATDRDGNAEIYKMSTDGSGTPTNLTQHPAYDADTAVSPDGKIAFVSHRDGNFEIYTMNADGTNQINRTNNPAWDSYPNYSSDGKQITFHSNRVGNFEVYKMNSDGTGKINLTNSPADEGAPDFSPDGKTIAFESNRDGNGGPAEIYAMTATDGSSQLRLTNNPAADGDPDWGPDTAPILYLPTDVTEVAADASGATVNYTATAKDDLDGSVPVECSPDAGSLFSIGSTTVSCSATDAAGNQSTGSFQVKVVYDFGSGSGGSFGEPVRDTELNRLAAGASVPVKFGLGGDFGLNIFAVGYPTSKQVSCPNGLPPDNVEETSTLSKSGLTYDATSGLYTYVWKTDRAWRGTCRELNLKLADGSDHRVQFQFT
jgi:Tol biopolymer transport system component/DNA-binding SARP family transcriptional activator